MMVSTINSKGQTTVPLAIRNALNVVAGTKLQWNLMPDGTVQVRVKSKPSVDLAGKR